MSRKHSPIPAAKPAPAPDTTSSSALSRNARIAISLFLAFNLFAIVSWCVPLDSPLIVRCRELAGPYLRLTGLFQKWDMFAPDPSKLNNYVGAVITYRDGTSSQWTFPRMEELGAWDRYLKERYRKYANDNLRLDGNAPIWPDAARYIARLNNRPGNPPVEVGLVRYWQFVPPPPAEGDAPPGEWNQYMFFRYNVAPGDLQ
jgi:hypothetical protein